MNIFIYQDFVHNTAPLHKALSEKYGHNNLRYVNANDITGGILSENPDLFVMPGGASRYMAAKLNGAGNAAIKHYVANGGRYLGICGGGYYACAKTIWAQGTEHEIITLNELAFFNGSAVGPITAFTTARNMNTADARLVRVEAHGKTATALYWAGAQFVPYDDKHTTLVKFADIHDNNAAVVSGTHGKGKWLLMSPHLEVDHDALQLMTFNVSQNRYADIALLDDTSAVSLELFHALLDGFLNA